ncbi:MAG: hypothetical protein N838_16025 [Thiohalocapsa sp. PB-PSB1]|nr:MAG: hypothetical protein N838_16025 [Thiohalocapsa sp. PB-PSB1]
MLLLLGSSLTVFAQSQLLSESEIPSQTQAQTQAQPLAPPVVGQEIDANAGAWEDRVDVLTEQAAELWQRSQQQADDLWQRSRQSADDWWQRSREATLDAWEDARDTLTPTEADAFGQVWTNVVPKLEETVSLEEAQKDLPDKAWFTRDKADAMAEINQLLDESVVILSTSPVQRYRDEIQSLEQGIAGARTDLDRYRKQRVAAPAKSLTTRTIDDYDRLIEEREQDIDRYRDELDRIKKEFAAELRAMGLELSDEQIEFLLSTVVGDSIVDLGIVFDNVKSITMQLEQLVRDSGEDLQSARRYYGMYVVLLRALNRMHLDVEQAIEQRYIPQINDISGRADALSDETRALMRELVSNNPNRAEVLKANLEAQRLTIEAASVYRQYLKQQAAQVRNARKLLEEDIATAWNTYETVRVSGELVDLVKSSQQLLDGLLQRQVPTLQPFRNLEMQREFAKLTKQLRTSQD